MPHFVGAVLRALKIGGKTNLLEGILTLSVEEVVKIRTVIEKLRSHGSNVVSEKIEHLKEKVASSEEENAPAPKF